MNNSSDIVVWEESFATGIPYIDNQHKELIKLTNDLYHACLGGEEKMEAGFKDAMHRMVEYVRFHFSSELKLLKKIKYPSYDDHKTEHDSLVRKILDAVKEYEAGKKYVPNSFVRTLKDWVFGHIAVMDKKYAAYVAGQLAKGLLSGKDIEGP